MRDTNERQAIGAHNRRAGSLAEYPSLGQGVFYLATGIRPLLSMRTFKRVTGPKTDKWPVKSVAVVISAVGGALTLAGAKRRVSPEIALLAMASATRLTAIDIIYVMKRRIAPVHLLDAAAELALIGGWLAAGWRKERS